MLARTDKNQYELIERLIRENLEIDFFTENPSVFSGNTSNNEIVSNENPDIAYMNSLCTEIKNKIDILQQGIGNLSSSANCSSVIKPMISALMAIDAELDYHVGDVNAMTDTMNNMAMQGTEVVIDSGNGRVF